MIYQALSTQLFIELSDKFDKRIWNLTIHHESLYTYEITVTIMSNKVNFVRKVLNYLRDKYGLVESINLTNNLHEYKQKFYNVSEEKIEQIYALYKMTG